MAALSFMIVILFVLGSLLWGLFRLVRPSVRRAALCRKCRYEVAGGVGSVGTCPECGSDYRRVGILPPAVPVPYTRAFIANALGLILILLGAVLYAPLAGLWPWHVSHRWGDSIYTQLRDWEPPARTVHITYDLAYVYPHPTDAGTVNLEVKGPQGQTSSLELDAATLRVRKASPESGVTAGAELTAADVRALYRAAGLDLESFKVLGAEADAIPGAILADVSAPQSMGSRSGIGPRSPMPSLARRGGSFSGSWGQPIVPLWGARVPLLVAMVLLGAVLYPVLLFAALRARRGASGPAGG